MGLIDDLEPLMAFLRDVLTPEEWDAAQSILTEIESGDAVVTADKRKSAADGHYAGAPNMTFVRKWRELQAAEVETGIVGMDSAAATYREACKRLGHVLPPMPVTGARTAYQLAKCKAAGKPHAMATDSAAIGRRNEMFPNANRLRRSY